MSERTGGPAFPYEKRDGDGFPVRDYLGMTMRDYFAAKAMQGMLANPAFISNDEALASGSYALADAMLKASDALKEISKNSPEGDAPKVGAGETALKVHGTVFFKDNHQYRSQLCFPVADGAYELVKIENPNMTDPLFNVAGESFEFL